MLLAARGGVLKQWPVPLRVLCALWCLCIPVVSGPAAETKSATLQVKLEEATSSLLFRAGPVKLAAGGGVQRLGFAPPLEYTMPLPGAAVAFRLRLADAAGAEVPGRLLLHAALENQGRKDLLCPGQPERLFQAYSAPLTLPEFPGIGFPVEVGDKIRFRGELDDRAGDDYPGVYVELRMYYRERGKDKLPVASAIPLWIEAGECGADGYDLPPGREVKRREVQTPRSGKILALAATGSEYAVRLLLERLPSETLADLAWQAEGAFPLVNWMPRGGTDIDAGQRFRVTTEFNNPAAATRRAAGRAAILAYFLPFEVK